MSNIAKLSLAGFLTLGLGSSLQAADLNDAVSYSLGEFDRVGLNQPQPKVQAPSRAKPVQGRQDSKHQSRELNAQKAEFVRRMFWMALSMR